MGHPGLDPETALQLIQTYLYCIACILGGSALLGLSAYIVFLCLELLSLQPGSKARVAEVSHPVGYAPVAEENLDLAADETPILVGAEHLGDALPHEAQMPMTLADVTLETELSGPWGLLNFLRFRQAVVLEKRRSSLRAKDQLEKLA